MITKDIWTCPECSTNNAKYIKLCKKCETPKPEEKKKNLELDEYGNIIKKNVVEDGSTQNQEEPDAHKNIKSVVQSLNKSNYKAPTPTTSNPVNPVRRYVGDLGSTYNYKNPEKDFLVQAKQDLEKKLQEAQTKISELEKKVQLLESVKLEGQEGEISSQDNQKVLQLEGENSNSKELFAELEKQVNDLKSQLKEANINLAEKDQQLEEKNKHFLQHENEAEDIENNEKYVALKNELEEFKEETFKTEEKLKKQIDEKDEVLDKLFQVLKVKVDEYERDSIDIPRDVLDLLQNSISFLDEHRPLA